MPEDAPLTLEQLGLFQRRSPVRQLLADRQLFPTSRLRAIDPTRRMAARGTPIDLPDSYDHVGHARSTAQLIEDTETSALLVCTGARSPRALRADRWRRRPWISMSVAKSFVSALVGIATRRGPHRRRRRRDQRLHPGAPGLGVRRGLDPRRAADGLGCALERGLQRPDVGRAAPGRGDVRDGAASRSSWPRWSPTCRPARCAATTRATPRRSGCCWSGPPVARWPTTCTRSWSSRWASPRPSAWLIDGHGIEAAFACLNVTARDFARLGELYRNGGRVDGLQVVPEAGCASRSSSRRRRSSRSRGWRASRRSATATSGGFPRGPNGEFSAIGVYNQFVYVDPARKVTIVKLVANTPLWPSEHDSDNREAENIDFLRAIAQHAAPAS